VWFYIYHGHLYVVACPEFIPVRWCLCWYIAFPALLRSRQYVPCRAIMGALQCNLLEHSSVPCNIQRMLRDYRLTARLEGLLSGSTGLDDGSGAGGACSTPTPCCTLPHVTLCLDTHCTVYVSTGQRPDCSGSVCTVGVLLCVGSVLIE
jgi:hypothetical protein